MEVKVAGLKEVEKNLESLAAVTGERVMRRVMFYAAEPMQSAAKGNVAALPRGSGALERAIRRMWVRGGTALGASGRRFTVAVGPKAKDRTAINLANLYYKRRKRIRGVYWGHFLEWGFSHVGGSTVPGRGLFRRAGESSAQEVISRFTDRIGRAVTRALKKQNAAE